MEMVLIFWLGFALLVSTIAYSKGRHSIGWLILGALFGIFALIAVCAMPRVDRA